VILVKILALFFHPTTYGTTPLGGVERRFIDVSKVMRRMNVSVYALEFYPSLKRSVSTGYVSHEMSQSFPVRLNEKVISVLSALISGIAIHRQCHCELVVVTGHRYLTFTVVCAYLLAKALRLPLVVVSGGLLPQEKMSLRSLVTERRKRGFTFLSALTHTVADWFTRLLYAKVSAFIAVSESERREAIRFLRVDPARIHVSGNGVDLELIDSIPKKEERFDAAFLGRIESGKGLNVLIDSWAYVVEQIPSAQLVVIGGGRLSHYKRLVALKNLSENIQFAGLLPFEQAMVLLKQSRIFLFPSLRESFPLSLLEAMACGLPCIVSDIQPLKETFQKGAVFVQPNDQAFATAIIDLLTHKSRRKALSLQARENAEMFGWEDVVKKEIKILEDVIS